MKLCLLRFNTVLWLGLLVLGTACQSLKKKDATTLRLHLETSTRAASEQSQVVEIGRDGLFTLTVEKEAFLNEGHVMKASVVKAMGGFQIMVEFNRQGSWILEQYTTASRGKHIAIFSQFGQARWIAAPTMTRTIKDGMLVFTPDVTLEEAERIVRGLNEEAKVLQKNNP